MLPTQPSMCCRYLCIALNLMAQERDQRWGDFGLSCAFLGDLQRSRRSWDWNHISQWSSFVFFTQVWLYQPSIVLFFFCFFNMPHALLPTGYRIFFLSTVLLYFFKGVLEMTLQKDARFKSFIQQKILKHTIKLAILIFSVLLNILISDFKPCCSL